MKKLILAALMFVAVAAYAQTTQTPARAQRMGAVNGQILDASSTNVMEGALILFRSVADTTFVRGGRSMPDGKFTVPNIPYGDYTVEVSFVGYEEYRNRLTVNMRNMTVAAFYMTPKRTVAQGVEVFAPMIRVSMHGDTIIYNPAAFSVAEDADSEAIIRQLPGVEVNEGTVTVNGKTVEKILVDDKETYGTDVQETMKTIPAAMLKSIQVYEKMSDFAETTGINDGSEYTVMNFETGIKIGHWGDASAMWGWEDMYAVGARWNIVTGGHRFGLNGGVNNTGSLQTFRDQSTPGMFGGSSGGSSYGPSASSKTKNIASGLTYNYEPTKKFNINAHYRYGKSKNEQESSTETQYFNSDNLWDRQMSASWNRSNYNNHSVGLSSRWMIDNRNTFNMHLNGSFLDNEGLSTSDQEYYALEELVRSVAGQGDYNSENYNLSGQVNYGIKLNEMNRSFRIGIEGYAYNAESDSFYDSQIINKLEGDPEEDYTRNTRSSSPIKNRGLEWHAEYYEPLSPYLYALLSAEGEYDHTNTDNRSEIFNAVDGIWSPWGQGSSVIEQNNSRHRIAPGLTFDKNNNEFRLRAGFDHFELDGESELPNPWKDNRAFNGLYTYIDYSRQITPQKRVTISFGSDNNTPDIDDLQGLDNVSSNGLSVWGGNPHLRTSSHYWSALYFSTTNMTNSSNISIWVHGNVLNNSVGSDRYTVSERLEGWDDATQKWTSPNGTPLDKGTEYTRPINIDRALWTVNTGIAYSRPLKSIKSNFNTRLAWSYAESPGRVNGADNTARSNYYSLTTNLNSNFSEDLTLRIGYVIMPLFTTNTNDGFRDSRRLTQSANMSFYWLTWKNFVLRAEASYNYMYSKQDRGGSPIKYETLMANVAIGKKLFKDRSGELTFAVNDLFDNDIYRNAGTAVDRITYRNDRGLGRYYSLTFRYRLRRFSE